MQIERLAFIAFPVSDLQRARQFYADSMGAPIVAEGADWTDFDLGGTVIRIYVHQGPYRRQHSGLQFLVENVDEAFVELMATGAKLRSDVRTEPWGGRVFTVSDPDGNVFDLLDASYVTTTA
jgi:catechol 2,3-dioxygenase-like lactoylglutathione lyase family enzyme